MDFAQLIANLRSGAWGRKTLAYGELFARVRRGVLTDKEANEQADKIEKAVMDYQAALDAVDSANARLVELEAQYQSLRG